MSEALPGLSGKTKFSAFWIILLVVYPMQFIPHTIGLCIHGLPHLLNCEIWRKKIVPFPSLCSPLDITVKKNPHLLDESMYPAKHLETDKKQILLKPIIFKNLLLALRISRLSVKYWSGTNVVYLPM